MDTYYFKILHFSLNGSQNEIYLWVLKCYEIESLRQGLMNVIRTSEAIVGKIQMCRYIDCAFSDKQRFNAQVVTRPSKYEYSTKLR
jgi:hypothetical protein